MTETNNSSFKQLHELANWYYPKPGIEPTVGIPRIQRGLVWSPQQIELLWDSILRGYPMGCFVVSNAVEDQKKRNDEDTKLQLLDGQQRSNTIALGFHNPFEATTDEETSSILWLDLNPNLEELNRTTRKFAFRLTKKAHPWGYKLNEESGILTASEIRASIECHIKKPNDEPLTRPLPTDLAPHKATYPVPMAMLLKATEKSINNAQKGWENLKCQLSKLDLPWANLAVSSEDAQKGFISLWDSLRLVHNAEIAMIEMPSELVIGDNNEGTSNIELLFNRLNTKGTSLGEEELQYSLIKAYLPQVDDVVDTIETLRMRPSRIVHLAIRAALTDPSSESMYQEISTTELRQIMRATDPQSNDVIKSQRAQIVTYFEKANGTHLQKLCKRIDCWLSYSDTNYSINQNKLPNFIISEMASHNKEVFLLLLIWAEKDVIEEDLINVLPGLTTALCWLSDKAKNRLQNCNTLYKNTYKSITLEKVKAGIQEANKNQSLPLIQSPESLASFIKDPHSLEGDNFKKWDWWHNLIIKPNDEKQDEIDSRNHQYWPCICMMNWNKSILLYHQRDYLWVNFKEYDQANVELWDGHNRPWDYDHILARSVVVTKRSTDVNYKEVCKKFVDTNGNFWACSFEDNRGYNDGHMEQKMEDIAKDASYDLNIKEGFLHGKATIEEEHKAKQFCEHTYKRSLKIYADWYTNSGIQTIMEAEPQTSP